MSKKQPLAKTTGTARLRKLADKEERSRLLLRMIGSVDDKLNDLAQLRCLDRNTAVCVAIAQDWIACFGRAGSSGS